MSNFMFNRFALETRLNAVCSYFSLKGEHTLAQGIALGKHS